MSRLNGSVDLLKKSVDVSVAWLTSPGLAVAVGEPLFRMFGYRRGIALQVEEVSSLLVVRLDQIGDAVLTTPLIRELRRGFPGASITLVVSPVAKELFDACPYVDDVITYDPRVAGRFPGAKRHWRALALSARRLWKKRIDLAIAPRFNKDMYHALFVAYFSGARWRAAYLQPTDRSGANQDLNRLVSHIFRGKPGVCHEVQRNLEFLEHLGVQPSTRRLELWTDERSRDKLERELASRGIAPGPLVAIAPGAREGKKIWPIDRFCALVPWLVEHLGMSIVVVGNGVERPLGDRLAAVGPGCVFNLCGVFSLRFAAALLGRCVLFVGNDSGPMHIAAACGVPAVDISAYPETGPDHRPMSPKRFGPWEVPHVVVRPRKPVPPCTGGCRSREAHCIRSVSVDEVKRAVEQLLQETGLGAGHQGASAATMNE